MHAACTNPEHFGEIVKRLGIRYRITRRNTRSEVINAIRRLILAFALGAGLATVGMAAEFKGYIIDAKCAKVAAMKGDVACATKCIKAGSPAVLVTDDGQVYKIAQQDMVVPMAGKQVTITGKLKGETISTEGRLRGLGSRISRMRSSRVLRYQGNV